MPDPWIKRSMLATDVGFLAYWLATAVQLIPPYPERVLVDWNWSFLVLDVFASVLGLMALWCLRTGAPGAEQLTLLSLALTHAAGLNALVFWSLRCEFDVMWWAPNLWLTIFPVVAALAVLRPRLTRDAAAAIR
ncbi:YvaD family protein [Allokutzneria multivorans]|uniref:YvaD family protein n=1 Tax=Allokutzneria multivorans TaxID=1142134 RepID=A0ABP7TAZ6_9PSEU